MIVVRYEGALMREVVWQPVGAIDPERPQLHRAVPYHNPDPEALYGQLLRLELAYWRQPAGWVHQVDIWLADGHGDLVHTTLPGCKLLPHDGDARAEAAHQVRQWLMLPTMNGVDWVGEPLQPEHLRVELSPAQRQALEWLRKHVGGTDSELIADAVSLLQALEEQHRRGNEVYLRKRTPCGHDEYAPYRYIVGDPTRHVAA